MKSSGYSNKKKGEQPRFRVNLRAGHSNSENMKTILRCILMVYPPPTEHGAKS